MAKKYTVSKTIEYTAALQITINSDENALLDYRIYGNTAQTGTQTPENPIIPNGCGKRTVNLADPTARIINSNITDQGQIYSYPAGQYDLGYFQIIQGNTYTIDSYVYAFYYTIPTVGSTAYNNQRVVGTYGRPSSFNAPITGYCCFRVPYGNSLMANNGFTALPYEPYGYKLPMTVSDENTVQTVHVYIGENKLTENEYVSYGEQKIYKEVSGTLTPTNPPVPIPEIPTFVGTTIINYDGTPKPSQMYIKYNGSGWSDMDNCKRYHKSQNLIDESKITNELLDTSSGTTTPDSDYRTTDYIWTISPNWYRISLKSLENWTETVVKYVKYDRNKGYIGGGQFRSSKADDQRLAMIFSADSAYYRFCWNIDGGMTEPMLNRDFEKPYEPYSTEVWHDADESIRQNGVWVQQ